MRTPRGEEWARHHQVPDFTSLHIKRAPDHLNGPRSERYPLHGGLPGLTHDLSVMLPDRRSSFMISEAAIQRLMAPAHVKSSRSSSSNALVQELADIAKDRLAYLTSSNLRDRLTSVLEEQSGMVATAATAVQVSRQYEAALRHGKPISIRNVTHALPRWPPQVQANFVKSLMQMGRLPYEDDSVQPAAAAIPDGSRLPEPGVAYPPPDAPPPQFAGLQGNAVLQPLGLALPALRTPRTRENLVGRGGGYGAGQEYDGGLAPHSAREQRPPPPTAGAAPHTSSSVPGPVVHSVPKPRSARTPRLAAMGSTINMVEPPPNQRQPRSPKAGVHAVGTRPNSSSRPNAPAS